MEHSFSVEVAKKYGISEAVILNNFYFWIEKNRANEKHYYDGRYWTYNSMKALSELFPYLTERQIKYTLNKMVENNLIMKGNYNKVAYDRTCWYAITDFGYSIVQNCLFDRTKLSNGTDEIVRPIPDNKPDNNTYNNIYVEKQNKVFKKPTLEEVEKYCSERKNRVDAEHFIDFYDANGWKVGKNPMKDWKAAVRTWEKNDNIKKNTKRETVYYETI